MSVMFAFCLISGLRLNGILQQYELTAYDLHLQYRAEVAPDESPVVLIRITENDIQKLKHYPITDNILAAGLEKLSQMGASVIGVDIFRDIPTQGRDRLINIMTNNTRIVVVDKILGENIIHAPEFIISEKQVGFADLKQDVDGVIRRALLMVWDDDLIPRFSFALQLTLAFLQESGVSLSEDPDDENNVRLNKISINRFRHNDGGYADVDDGGYQFLLSYERDSKSFPSYTLSDLLNDRISKEAIKRKVIILGVTADSVQDYHETPFSHHGPSRPMFGIEIHAHAVEQLIAAALYDRQQISVLDEIAEYSGVLLFAVIGAIAGLLFKRVYSLFLISTLFIIVLVLFAHYFFLSSVWVPVIPWVLAFLMAVSISTAFVMQSEAFSHKLIKEMFGKFVTPEIAELLWQQRDQFMVGGRPKQQELNATVIIADIEHSAEIMENMKPQQALEWSNICLSMVTDVAIKYGGLVDDYAGDGIKVNFGVPVPRITREEIQHDCVQAIECALEIGRNLSEVNESMMKKNWPIIRLRIGISTGLVAAGSQGSFKRMKYTTVGDTVNIAARLESFDKDNFSKELDKMCRIIVTQNTINYVGDKYKSLDIDVIKHGGSNSQITLYRIL